MMQSQSTVGRYGCSDVVKACLLEARLDLDRWSVVYSSV
jgi:hypothetical protein